MHLRSTPIKLLSCLIKPSLFQPCMVNVIFPKSELPQLYMKHTNLLHYFLYSYEFQIYIVIVKKNHSCLAGQFGAMTFRLVLIIGASAIGNSMGDRVNIRLNSWIEWPWPENPANTYARHTEILDSCFDLIRSSQLCIPWSPQLEIEPATTDCRAETLQLSQQFISLTSDAKLTRHGNVLLFPHVVRRCSPDFLVMVIQFTI